MDDSINTGARIHTVSVVIPVYQGERTLSALVDEIIVAAPVTPTPEGNAYRVSEIVLVYDNGKDQSDEIMRRLEADHQEVRAVWLSRNYGQHAATLAGMASSSGEWVVTLDEDGQHDPRDIGALLDSALRDRAQVVYAKPINPPPHGLVRNAASRNAKSVANRIFGTSDATSFNSYRLIIGSVARGVAAYSGSGVYLDVALSWVAGRYSSAPTTLRGETRASGYNYRRLLGHFWRLVLTSGTKGLRLVSITGAVFAAIGVLVAVWLVIVKLTTGIDAQGWTSTIVILLVIAGAILFSLGIIAEYIGISVNMAMGKPSYFITSDPGDGPLGRPSPRVAPTDAAREDEPGGNNADATLHASSRSTEPIEKPSAHQQSSRR